MFLLFFLAFFFFLFFVFLFVFFVFFCLFVVFLSFFVFFVGGFKGQVRWPFGPPHLALNPPYFFFCFCMLFFVLFFFGGFKGQVRWPKGPPHLALNPPYLFLLFLLFCFFLVLFFWLFNTEKNLVFPPRKGHFLFIFSVSLSFSLSPFGPPSFSVSLYLSLFFLLFVLPSFLSFFAFFWFLVFVPFLFLSLSSLLFFHERNNIKILNCKFFFEIISYFSFLPFFLSSSFFLSLLFPDFKLCFLFNIKVFGFKTKNLEKTFFGQKGGCNKTVFFINLCFAKCQKLSFFFGHFFWQFLVDVQKNTIKIGISAHF